MFDKITSRIAGEIEAIKNKVIREHLDAAGIGADARLVSETHNGEESFLYFKNGELTRLVTFTQGPELAFNESKFTENGMTISVSINYY